MNWQQQTEEMFKTWTDSQKKVWENWTDAMKGFGTTPNTEMWGKTLDTWQTMVKNGLDTQGQWTKTMVDNVTKIEGVPAPVVEMTKQSQEMNARWNEMQQQMWNNWFDLVKKMDPSTFAKFGGEDGKNLFQTWQDSMQQMMKTQTEWVNTAATATKDAVKKATDKK